MFAEDRAAGFGIFLAVTLAYMEHEAECNSKYEIESPWNQAPVEDRIGTCPVPVSYTHLAGAVYDPEGVQRMSADQVVDYMEKNLMK